MAQASEFKRVVIEPNKATFEEGGSANAVFLIVDGKVEIRVNSRGDNPRRLATVRKGEVIGELALFDDVPHMATAVALTRTEALSMSRQDFRRRLDDMDPVMRGIVRLLVKRLRQMVLTVASNDDSGGARSRQKITS